MDAIATAEVPEVVLRMSKEQPNPVPVGSQPYPSAEDVPMDSAQCRLRLNKHRHCFTCWKGECLTCRMSYPRQFANRTYFAQIVPDPTSTKDLVPTRRFPTDDTGVETISEPPLQIATCPVDPYDDRVIASGLRRTSKIEQSMCESNPLTTVL